MSLLFQRDVAGHDGQVGGKPTARRVVVRLHDADAIVLLCTASRAEALATAQQAVREIDTAVANGCWAELQDRLVRPEAIESVDIELAED